MRNAATACVRENNFTCVIYHNFHNFHNYLMLLWIFRIKDIQKLDKPCPKPDTSRQLDMLVGSRPSRPSGTRQGQLSRSAKDVDNFLKKSFNRKNPWNREISFSLAKTKSFLGLIFSFKNAFDVFFKKMKANWVEVFFL